MKRLYLTVAFAIAGLLFFSCKKEPATIDGYSYYQVGFGPGNENWRDTTFVVRTKDSQLIQKADAQLLLPIVERKIVFGELIAGSGGYNKNASHVFKWRFKEESWDLVDVTIEIYDGKPFTDVDSDTSYWLNNMKRFGAWSSHIKKKLPGKP